MRKKLYEFMADTSGATMIEYGFIAGSIALTLVTAAFVFGDDFATMMQSLSGYMDRSTIN